MGWQKGKFIDGVAEWEVDGKGKPLEDFTALCGSSELKRPSYHNRLAPQFVFRGHKEWGYDLWSSFHREYNELDPSNRPSLRKQAEAHLKRFRQAMRGRISLADRDITSSLELWAIAQHYGMWTPLLDWSESIFMAAFFAFEEERKHRGKRAVWCLNETEVEKKFRGELGAWFRTGKYQKEYKYLRKAPLLDRDLHKPYDTNSDSKVAAKVIAIVDGICSAPSRVANVCRLALEETENECVRICRPRSGQNARIVPQMGLFTYHLGNEKIDTWVRRKFPGKKRKVLIRIMLPDKCRSQFLEGLNSMGINHLSTFPDLIGVAKYCNSSFTRDIWPYAYPAT